ncbi:unnamed protein product [Brachionus calyciflorus]|uniref:FAD-dependent oxidoreductase domain-containing protein 1 n=1 Tax=Brachionus calyciflorus TaxID=104777 RepID=A0A813SVW4_9BILA|nr:unnamed protein product [Brachionus calyciflorus]
MKDTKSSDTFSGKIRVPGADDPKNALEVFKIQYENFKSLKKINRVPKQTEVLVIGGGIIGSFIAYWIKQQSPSLNVTVIEKDSNYSKSSTFWSLGGFRQQFSLPENIKMSLFGAEFMQNSHELLKCEKNYKVDLQFNHDGYLFLASTKTADQLYHNHRIQLAHKARVQLLNKEELKQKFKWINPEGIELASFGYQNEGWVDARKFLLAVRNKANFLGAEYVNGEVISFENDANDQLLLDQSVKTIKTALVDTLDGKLVPIKFQTVVNAAGPWAGEISKLASESLGSVKSQMSDLPVEPRKRYIFMFYAENGPILNVPLTIDQSGVFFRRQGLSNYYFCGLNQSPDKEPKDLDLEKIDFEYFEKEIKPVLIHRVPAFKDLKLINAWAGYYDYNTLDQNLIIGKHPIQRNFIFANGSSGHGLQHSAAIGRAVSELIIHDSYQTIDLKRFGFERVLRNQPLKEIDVV